MFVYNEAVRAICEGEIDLPNADLRVLLVMSNTTADTERNVDVLDDFTSLDEMDGANYARTALTSLVGAVDAANNRYELDADDVAFASLGAGTRSVVGLLLYLHVTDDTDSVPIAYWSEGFPYAASGNTLTIIWSDEGVLHGIAGEPSIES